MKLDIISYYSQLRYVPAHFFAYDASDDVIHFDSERIETNEGRLCLLHETSHALLGHLSFSTELELYLMEVAAWRKTRELAQKFHLPCDEEYIEECLATYEYWLMSRATCPQCNNFCLPATSHTYSCFLCGTGWHVADVTNHSTRRRKRAVFAYKIPLLAGSGILLLAMLTIN